MKDLKHTKVIAIQLKIIKFINAYSIKNLEYNNNLTIELNYINTLTVSAL
ncbi:hypothetical protein GCM10022259_27060 [Aquimarina mytili]